MPHKKDSNFSDEIINYNDSKKILKEAIEQIEQFTEPSAVSLNVEETGRLVALKPTRLEKVIKLARHFIDSLFSHQARETQAKKLELIKQKVSHAVDIIQSHTPLIEQMQEGKRIIEIIDAFNKLVTNPSKHVSWTEGYFERSRVLRDKEIRERQIRLPHIVSVKYESTSNSHLAKKNLEEFGNLLQERISSKKILSSTHKKNTQEIKDFFRIKAIRTIQQHSSICNSEIISLIQKIPIEIDEDSSPSFIYARQIIELAPGSIISLMGVFKKTTPNSKLMSIPVLEDFNFRLQSIQTGYPYPSQYALFAFADTLVDVNPLREKQVPFFFELDNRKKKMAQELLFDQNAINKSKLISIQNKSAYNQNTSYLLDLHKDLQTSMIKACPYLELTNDNITILNKFYNYLKGDQNTFDKLVNIQEQINNIVFVLPTKKLLHEWLKGHQQLRTGTLEERYIVALEIFKMERHKNLVSLQNEESILAFIYLMVNVYGSAGESIILHHQSEKIGFMPPKLTDFEKRIQLCSFDQLMTFLDELETDFYQDSIENRAKVLEDRLKRQISFFEISHINCINPSAWQLIEQVEEYIHSRFYL